MSRDTLLLLFAILGALVALITIWLFVRPHLRRLSAVGDAILGVERTTDRAGRVISEEKPGLVSRVAVLEEKMTELSSVERLVIKFQEHDGRLDRVEVRVGALETQTVERIVTRNESAAAWQALNELHDKTPEVEE